jgi:hypothetical protein
MMMHLEMQQERMNHKVKNVTQTLDNYLQLLSIKNGYDKLLKVNIKLIKSITKEHN